VSTGQIESYQRCIKVLRCLLEALGHSSAVAGRSRVRSGGDGSNVDIIFRDKLVAEQSRFLAGGFGGETAQ
jgi:hypothetical protein